MRSYLIREGLDSVNLGAVVWKYDAAELDLHTAM
jgi:hypothetical protein